MKNLLVEVWMLTLLRQCDTAKMAACPFLAGAAHRSGSQTLPSGQGGCPLGFSNSAKHDAQASSSPSETAACPYGFSASNVGPKLSSLHCTLCKQPMHDCCSCSPCGHKFCKFCVSRTRDCPVCGQDIEGLVPDPTTQALVDVFLAAHATGGGSLSSPQELQALWVAAGGAPLTAAADSQDSQLPLPAAQAEGQALPSAAAAFFLQLGLQAMRAGNPEAGLHRLEMCKAELISVAGQAASTLGSGSGSSNQSEAPQDHANVHAHHTAVGSMAASMNAKGGCPFHASNPGETEPLAQQQQQRRRQQQVPPPAACPFHTGSQAATPASASAPAAPSAPTPTSASAPAPSTSQADTTASATAPPPAVNPTSTPTSAPCLTSNPAIQPPSQAPTHPLRLAPPLRLPATLAAPLGAVFGAQGDASKALGLLGQAAALYAASVSCTQAAANLEHPEATHVMTVSINKLGDCHFLGQRYDLALEAYERALALRLDQLRMASTSPHAQHATAAAEAATPTAAAATAAAATHTAAAAAAAAATHTAAAAAAAAATHTAAAAGSGGVVAGALGGERGAAPAAGGGQGGEGGGARGQGAGSTSAAGLHLPVDFPLVSSINVQQALEVVACLIKVADASSAAADCLHLQPQPSTSTTASATTSWSAQGGAKQAGCPLHGMQGQQQQQEQQEEKSREKQGGRQPEAQGCSGGAAAAAAAAAMSKAEGPAQALQLSCRSAAALEAAQQLLSQVDHLLGDAERGEPAGEPGAGVPHCQQGKPGAAEVPPSLAFVLRLRVAQLQQAVRSLQRLNAAAQCSV